MAADWKKRGVVMGSGRSEKGGNHRPSRRWVHLLRGFGVTAPYPALPAPTREPSCDVGCRQTMLLRRAETRPTPAKRRGYSVLSLHLLFLRRCRQRLYLLLSSSHGSASGNATKRRQCWAAKQPPNASTRLRGKVSERRRGGTPSGVITGPVKRRVYWVSRMMGFSPS